MFFNVFVRNSTDGGEAFGSAVTLDRVTLGHQWIPDVASARAC
jgi:hypothetical protein